MSLLLNNHNITSFHFVGILGSGMSAIAQYLRWTGCVVSGSDRMLNKPSTRIAQKALSEMGCSLYKQDGSGIKPTIDAIVLSTAIEESNLDVKKANEYNITIFHRSDILAAIIASKRTIAIAGTSGKSSVSAIIFHLLAESGMKPSYIAGANLHALTKKGVIGNAWYDSSDILVVEADESDGTIVKYHPYLSVILNISKDHKLISEVFEMFKKLSLQSKHVLINGNAKELANIPATSTFSLENEADFQGELLANNTQYAGFQMVDKVYKVPFPGRYMADNLLAAVAACHLIGCNEVLLPEISLKYRGIERRFDRYFVQDKITVIDDYAHNPEKIAAAITTAQTLSSHLHILFQPHGFGPMRFMFDDLKKMFKKCVRSTDKLYLLPIYFVGGTVVQNISSEDLAVALSNECFQVKSLCKRELATALICSDIRPSEIVLSMGARDPSLPDFAKSLANAIGNAKSK